MGENKYTGTKGLTMRTALNRIYELETRAALGGQEKEYFNEAKKVIEDNIEKVIKESIYWNKVEDKLTAKQLLHVLKS